MPHYTAVVTLLAIALYGFMGMRVSAARRRFHVSLPATSGHPDFERVYRAHMNTLEWMPIFLVTLWLCAIYLSDVMGAAVGIVWIAGRAWYFAGYSKAVEKRLPGFFIQSAACLVLLIGAAAGIVMRFGST
jgi:glutathione S-transferase